MLKFYHWLNFNLVVKRKLKKNIVSIVKRFIKAGMSPDEAASRTCKELNKIDGDGTWSITATKK